MIARLRSYASLMIVPALSILLALVVASILIIASGVIGPEKRVDLQVEAFRRMPGEKLIVVGGTLEGDNSSGYLGVLMADKPANVEFVGRKGEKELIGLYGRCRGFICTAQDEDLGLTPIEAMASGKPVIAVGEGGYLETVVDGETGVFVEATPEALAKAVKDVGLRAPSFRPACEKRARTFGADALLERIEAAIRN